MGKLVLGAYESEADAITAINVYELAGHQSKHITIFTNEEMAKSLAEQTSVTIKTNNPPKKGTATPLFHKIKNAFSSVDDFELDSHDKLVEFGLSDEKAKRCMSEMEAGKIVVLADDELRMGHAPFSVGDADIN